MWYYLIQYVSGLQWCEVRAGDERLVMKEILRLHYDILYYLYFHYYDIDKRYGPGPFPSDVYSFGKFIVQAKKFVSEMC